MPKNPSTPRAPDREQVHMRPLSGGISSSPLRSKTLVLIALMPWLVLFGWLAEISWFLTDDAFISSRYVRNLVEGHGLVFNRGERVEGYSNFL